MLRVLTIPGLWNSGPRALADQLGARARRRAPGAAG